MKKLLVLALLVFAACRTELPLDEKLARANMLLSEHGGEPAYRAIAYDLYKDVLDGSKTKEQRIQSHFGVGIIGVFDLVQGVPTLLAEPEDGEAAEETEPPPADALAETIDTLVHQAIDRNIAAHLGVVAAEDDFEFVFKRLSFPTTDPTKAPLDLSGEWDLTEVRMLYGALEAVVALEEIIYSYDGVLATVLEAALGGAELPPLPLTPVEYPNWLVAAAEAANLDPLPWLDPAFGVLGKNNRIEKAAERFDVGFKSMADAFVYLQGETDDQNLEVFPNDSYLISVVETLTGGDLDPLIKGAVSTTFSASLLEDIFARLHTGAVDTAKPFLLPNEVADLLEMLLGISYEGPQDLVALRLPAISIAALLKNPITDLKDLEEGLFPFFNAQGVFIVESEQEPRSDGELLGEPASGDYEDIGVDGFFDVDGNDKPDSGDRPGIANDEFDFVFALRAVTSSSLLKHKAPNGDIEVANGIVDPVYLFFGDASFHGFFVPITDSEGPDHYEADLAAEYGNEDLMRLVSSLVWLIAELM